MIEEYNAELAADLPMPPTQALTAAFDLDANLHSLAQGMAGGTSTHVADESRQGFRIGELRLMIAYEDSSLLSEMLPIHRLPNAPDWFSGIANVHGKLTPVFDMARYLGIEEDPDVKRMLLVLGHGSDAAGILIDGLPERLRRLEKESTDAGAAPELLMPHLRGACHLSDKLWFDLDAQSLLGALEQSLGAAQ